MDSTPRCSRHKDQPTLPRLCATCQRIAVERILVERTVDDLLAAGYSLATDQAGELEMPFTDDRQTILAQMMETDDEHLFALKDGKSSWVYFVYGNDGWDVISDYLTNLEAIIDPICDYANTLDTRS